MHSHDVVSSLSVQPLPLSTPPPQPPSRKAWRTSVMRQTPCPPNNLTAAEATQQGARGRRTSKCVPLARKPFKALCARRRATVNTTRTQTIRAQAIKCTPGGGGWRGEEGGGVASGPDEQARNPGRECVCLCVCARRPGKVLSCNSKITVRKLQEVQRGANQPPDHVCRLNVTDIDPHYSL